MKIEQATIQHLDEIFPMALDLWRDYDHDELKSILNTVMSSPKYNILLAREREECVGFIYVGIRHDYVEGSDQSPTGYIEGIYVKPDRRRSGVARALLNSGEQWIRYMGCGQVASDIYYDNTTSYDFHIGVGFREAAKLITFIKDIDPKA